MEPGHIHKHANVFTFCIAKMKKETVENEYNFELQKQKRKKEKKPLHKEHIYIGSPESQLGHRINDELHIPPDAIIAAGELEHPAGKRFSVSAGHITPQR